MPKSDLVVRRATALVRRVSDEGQRLARRKRRRVKRVVQGIALMFAAPFVIVPAMIATGLLFGPRGIEGLIAAPLALFATWAVIGYWAFRRRPTQLRLPAKATLPDLVPRVQDWIEAERPALPRDVQAPLDRITLQLDQMTELLVQSPQAAPAGVELRRLLGEELPELVRGFRVVPPTQADAPLYDGATPAHRLREGLEAVDKQLTHLHERLAADSVHSWAAHQRYLDLKYNPKDDMDP